MSIISIIRALAMKILAIWKFFVNDVILMNIFIEEIGRNIKRNIMASPQCENGHTRIAHEITEAIVRSSLSGAQLRAVLWVLRLTYGFQRKEVITNVGAFATKLKSSKDYVKDVFNQLEQFKVITLEWATPEICKIKFNKDFDKWRCFL